MNQEPNPSRGYVPPPEFEDDGGVELGWIIAVISESRWLILAIATSVFLLGSLYTLLATPIYETYSDLLVTTNKSGGFSGLEQLSALVEGSSLPTATEIQLLQTRAVLVPVIEKLHLNIRIDRGSIPALSTFLGLSNKPAINIAEFKVPPELEGQALTVEPTGDDTYSLLDPQRNKILDGRIGALAAGRIRTDQGFGVVNLRINSLGGETNSFKITRASDDQSVNALRANIKVEEVGLQTGIVRATLQGISPRLITRELNELTKQNVDQNARRSAVQAASQLQFLKAQLPAIERKFQEAQKNLSDFLSAHRTLVFSQDVSYLTSRASMIEQQIGPLEAEIAAAKAALGTRNPELTTLQAKLDVLNNQRDELFASLSKLPKDQQTLIRLQSDATTSQSLYQAILNQTQALQIAEAGAVGDVVIIDPATVSMKPVLPNKPLDITLALVLGLIFGVGAAFGRRALRNGIEDPNILDTVLGLPVYAVIAHSSRQQNMDGDRHAAVQGKAHLLLTQEQTSDAAGEGLKSLRTSLQLVLPKAGPRVICLSSLGPGEGKTFVSSNLSYLFAQSGLRVLIVDADMRRGHLHKVFGFPRGPGLAELLANQVTQGGAIHSTQIERLDLLTTGALPPDAANHLLNSDFGGLVQRLADSYDLVVIDVPPVLAVSDAFLIARYATLNLLLLKYGLHSERQVQLVQKRFDRHGIELVGSILNDVTAASQRYAYYQYGYKYQYEYKPTKQQP